MTLLSMRQYAKHRGVSPEAVSKAVRMGRISTVLDEEGRRKINPEVADVEWDKNSDKSKVRNEEPEPVPAEEEKKGPSYANARAFRETFAAKLARLEFDERSGKLVDAEQVKSDAFRAARSVRDALLNLPDRLSAELASESNQFVVHRRLSEEIRKALESLQKLDET